VARVNDVLVNVAHDSTYVLGFGHRSDLEVVERLYASLAVQMTVAAQRRLDAGEHREAGVAAQTWRLSFFDGWVESVGRRLGWEARRLRERGVAVSVLQPVAEDLEVMRGNLMSTARRHLVLETAQRTVAGQLRGTGLLDLLADQPRAPEHRLRRPPGPVRTWPPEALPPRTSVGPAGQDAGEG